MIYLDTSSLLKLVISDEHSTAVEQALAMEPAVVVSSHGRLEAGVQIRALTRGGKITAAKVRRATAGLDELLGEIPFVRRDLAGTVFATALRQHESSQVHCRSLDRLHLAAMQELGLRRLMSHDSRQIEAARELGFEINSPGL